MRRDSLPVLMYHRVCAPPGDPFLLAVPPKRFSEHMELLRRRWHPTGLRDAVAALLAGELPERAVAVTFDDGYADNLLCAAPELERHAVPATVFVTSGHIGSERELWWDELERIFLTPGELPQRLRLTVDGLIREWDLGGGAAAYPVAEYDRLRGWNVLDGADPGPRQAIVRELLVLLRGRATARRDALLAQIRAWAGGEQTMRESHRGLTPDELRRLAASPLIEIGGHTVTHPQLAACTWEHQAAEISDGKRRIEDVLGEPLRAFAYPFGSAADYTPETVEHVRAAGFEVACSNFEGRLTAVADPLQVPRLMVLPGWSADELDARLRRLAGTESVPFAGARGFLDAPTEGSEAGAGLVRVAGWAAFAGADTARVEVTVDGGPAGSARIAELRPDVAEALGDPDVIRVGFEHFIAVPAGGDGDISVVARALDGRELRLGARIRPAPLGLLTEVPPSPTRRARRWFPATRRGPARVFVVAHSMEMAGAELSLLELLRGLSERGGFEIALATPRAGPLLRRFEALGIGVRIVAPLVMDSVEGFEAAANELTGLARDHGATVVLANTMVAAAGVAAAERLGIGAVWAVHEGWGPELFWRTFFGELDPALRARYARALRGATATVFVADATRRLYEPWIDARRAHTVPYAVDFDALDHPGDDTAAHDLRRRMGVPQDATVMLAVGPVVDAKCQSLLIGAFRDVAAAHPHARLVLLGDLTYPYAARLRGWVSASGLDDRVHFHPPTPAPQAFYRAADWLVSASDVESMPRTIVEALACELPVAASAVGGIGELIEHGATGYLCAPRDHHALAEMLDQALATVPAKRMEMAAAGGALVRSRHRREACAAAYAVLLRA